MAIIQIPRSKTASEQISDALLTGLGLYGEYKIKQKQQEKRKGEVEKALKAMGYSKKESQALSGLPKDLLGTVLSERRMQAQQEPKTAATELQQQNLSAVLQGRGYPKNEADIISRSGNLAVKDALMSEGYEPGTTPMPNIGWQQQLRDPNQRTMGEALGIQPQQQQEMQAAQMMQQVPPPVQSQEPMGQQTLTQDQQEALMRPQEPTGPGPLGFARSDPAQVKELKNLFQEGFQSGELTQPQAEQLLNNLGVDKMAQKVILSNTLTPDIVQYFQNMAGGNADKVIKLARAYGFKVTR